MSQRWSEGVHVCWDGTTFGGASTTGASSMAHTRGGADVASACRGFGGKWRARIEGNRGTEWRLDSGVGIGERFWEVGFRVYGGFELNDEKFCK